MQPNYTPEHLLCKPEEVSASNHSLDALCRVLQAPAEQAFRTAIARQTAIAGAADLAGETLAALQGMLRELGDEQLLDHETQNLSSALAAALATATAASLPPDLSPGAGWIRTQGRDLARALASLWSNLAASDSERRTACRDFLGQPGGAAHRTSLDALDRLCARFHLERGEAGLLLSHLNHYRAAAPDLAHAPRPRSAQRELTASMALQAGQSASRAQRGNR